MTIEEIKQELENITRIIGAWDNINAIAEIEKDVVLDKLRMLYDTIKFSASHMDASVRYEMPVIDMDESADEESESEPETSQKSSMVAVESESIVPTVELGMSAVKKVTKESSVETGSFAETEQIAVKQAEIKQSVEKNSSASERELFRSEEVAVRPKLDRKVILSLYGEEEPAGKCSDASLVSENVATEGQEESERTVVEPVVNTPTSVPETILAEQHTTVLGEVMKNGEETIADVYAKQSHTTDIASKIVSDRTSGLRKAIGINDKFLMIRDLFGGDAQAYEQAISDLEQMTDLDDALLYLHDHHWNPNCDGMKMLVELLTRKLS